MSSERQFFSNINKPFVLVKWKVQKDSHLFLSATVLTYKNSDGESDANQEHKLKSTVEGTIVKLLVDEGDVVQPGSPLLTIQPCTHELIVKEICAQCGTDLQKMFEILPDTDLKVTHQQAEQLEKAGEQDLLKMKKLALLICLDKTLLDTVPAQDVGCASDPKTQAETYCTKVRPGARRFLKNISDHYELHAFTDGHLNYAYKLADILDPKGELFSGRIYTRHDCFNSTTVNLKSSFCRGNSMVCIVDWQENNQELSSNVIIIKPFSYIPSPTQKQSDGTHDKHPSTSPETNSCVKTTHNVNGETGDTVVNDEENRGNASDSDRHVDNLHSGKQQLSSRQIKEESMIMSGLESALIEIHKAYYELYNQMVEQQMYIIHHKAIPDLKEVIPYYRQRILKGVNIVFSGVFPTNIDALSSPLGLLAKSLGAGIYNEVFLNDKEKGTTHIIAAKLGTNKTNKAKRFHKIHVVSPGWLAKCAVCWKHVDENPFRLDKNESIKEMEDSECIEDESVLHNVSMSENEEGSPSSNFIEKECSSQEKSEDFFTEALDISPEALKDMTSEVNEECTDDDSQESLTDTDSDVECNMVRKRGTCQLVELDILDSDNRRKKRQKLNGGFSVRLKNSYVPIWQHNYHDHNHDYGDTSDSENYLSDYIYSEDEDPFLIGIND